ncbi:DsbA family protein [Rhodoblastus acidophilus]|uniref:DsbA family protein n=1 Tax=Rhodoblastus acidophilus TaxID=1074 RepID=UPI003CD01C28
MLTNRRSILKSAFSVGSVLLFGLAGARTALAEEITFEAIVNDPEAPVTGNLKGDVVIAAFFDYNCPFCKKSAPDLDRLVKTDGAIKLVYKDCPILTEASFYGARMALAARYQGAYERVHAKLMSVPGRRNPQSYMEEAVASSSVDVARLNADLEAHGSEIDALIRRNVAQARALGFQGVPDFLIGRYKASGYLDYDELKSAVAQARAPGREK